MANTTAVPIHPTYPSPHAAHFVAVGSWPQQSLGSLLARTAQRHAAREALIEDGTRLTFHEFERRVQQVVAQLYRQRWQVEFFAQDSWRVSRRLNIDYGARFAWQSAPAAERIGLCSSAT